MTRKKLAKIFISIATCLTLALAPFAGTVSSLVAYAARTSVSVQNGNFNTFTTDTDSTVNVPSSWTVSATGEHAGIVAGVQSVADVWDIGTTNPGLFEESWTDKNILLISSTVADRYGFKSSSSITLSSNSYYEITVYACVTAGTIGTIGLSGNIADELVVDKAEWTEYKFLVETDAYTSKSVNIELWLGSKINNTTSVGTVFFDNITVNKIDMRLFRDLSKVNPTTTLVHSERIYDELNLPNIPSFEDPINSLFATNWSIISDGDESNIISVEELGTGSVDGEYALKMKNDNNVGFLGVKSSDIQIRQYATYRISVFAKLVVEGSSKSTGSIKLTITDSASGLNKTQTQTLAASTTNSTYNNWTEYVFAVRGSHIANSNVNLQFGITGDNTVAYFDKVSVERISQTNYTGTSNQLDLASSAVVTGITNGRFNYVDTTAEYETISDDNYLPISASNWTTFGDDVSLGVVSLNSDRASDEGFDFSDFKNAISFAPTDLATLPTPVAGMSVVDNAYAIHSKTPAYAGATCTSVTVNANTYGSMSVWVNTANLTTAQADASIVLKSTSSNEIVARYDGIITNGTWRQYQFYIAGNSTSSVSYTISISLGSEFEDSTGTVFFASATYSSIANTLFDSTAEKTMAEQIGTRTITVDNNLSFTRSSIKNENGLYSVLNYKTSTANSESVVGIVCIKDIEPSCAVFSQKAQINAPENSENDEFLIIYNPTASQSSAKQNTGTTTSETGYIKISINVKLINTTGKGAYVYFDNLNTTVYVDPNATKDANGWSTVEVYANTGSTTIGLITATLGLGEASADNSALVSGIALFDTISIEASTKDAYKNATKSTNSLIATADTTTPSDEVDDEEETAKEETTTEDEDKKDKLSLFFIILSSVVLVGALVIALVAVGMKKLPKRVSVKIPDSGIKDKNTGKQKKGSGSDKGFI